ncbi:MAG: N-acetylglucosamine-6-phosphate deacetylase [Gammaproteobacteria bacterium]|nr:N-acetylglucosamine-6-phosphate deacetylase [Gammaproteobacteria bacterium]
MSEGTRLQNQVITVQNGLIENIEPASTMDHYDWELDPHSILIPGLIDLHIHGIKGHDVMDGTPNSLSMISKTLAEEGVTGFLATTMTESIARIEAAIDNSVYCQKNNRDYHGAEILGLHLEGPFLSTEFMGAQCGIHLLQPNPLLLEAWQKRSAGSIKILTLAPELPQALELIDTAKKLGIVASLGHTAASFNETLTAIDRGATHATHLFNAMRGIHHRTPGAAAALLMDERMTAEIIVDGLHIAPEMIRFIFQLKKHSQLVLVTDAMSAKCLKNGEYVFGGQTVILKDQEARLKKNGALAGSTLCLNQALKNAHQYTGIALEKLIPLATSIPAKILKMNQQIGSISQGKKANFAVLNQDLEVQVTMREGRVVYKKPGVAQSLPD